MGLGNRFAKHHGPANPDPKHQEVSAGGRNGSHARLHRIDLLAAKITGSAGIKTSRCPRIQLIRWGIWRRLTRIIRNCCSGEDEKECGKMSNSH